LPKCPSKRPKTKSVLIVDDDESMLNLLEILVKKDGFQIDLARTATRRWRSSSAIKTP